MRFTKRASGRVPATSSSPASTPDAPTTTDAKALAAGRPIVQIRPFRFGVLGALGVLVALGIGQVVADLSTVLTYVGIALFLALGLDPLVSWLEGKKVPRPLAIAIVFVGVLAIFTGLLLYLIPILVTQVTYLINNGPAFVVDLSRQGWVLDLEQRLQGVVQIDQLISSGLDFIQDPNNLLTLGGGILAVGSGIANGVTGTIIVLILTLYFLSSIRSMKRVAYHFAPASKRDRAREVGEEITGAVGRYVVGQVTLAAVNGVLSIILLTVIGAPLPALLAFIAFLCSLIPLVGTISGAVIISLACLIASPLTALVAAIYYLVYMQVEAYILSPRIMNRAVAVPGAVVVIAAVAGGTLAGILGALVAIPVAASVIIIIQKVVFPAQDLK